MVVQRYFDGLDGIFSYLDWGGQGPVVHVAHATGFCAGVYSPLSGILASRLKVIGMDYRGHGRTLAPADPAKLTDWNVFADDLAHFLRSFHQPVVCVGHSLGAVTSLLMAVKNPDIVEALILIDPTMLPQHLNVCLFLAQKLGLTGLFPIVSGAARRTKVWPSKQTVLEAYRKRAPFNKWSEGFLEAYVEFGFQEIESGGAELRCEPEWESKCFSSCPAGIWQKPGLLQAPVLIIYGSDSDVFLDSCARKFTKKVPTAELRCLEHVSHFVPMEKPEQTASLIIEFMEQNHIL